VSNVLGPSLDVVHLSNGLGPVVLVDHSSQELVSVVCASPAYQLLFSNEDLLVVQDGIDVGDDTVIRGGIDSLLEVLLGTPFGTPGSLLLKLSQIPEIVAIISCWQVY
jgi:hypothetical protein